MPEWRSVKNWEGVYEVSSVGDVRRIAAGRTGPKPKAKLRTFPDKDGYLQVKLSKQPKREQRYTYHLVMEAFGKPAPSPKHIRDHRDRNKLNNSIGNLRWVTYIESNLNRGPNGDLHA